MPIDTMQKRSSVLEVPGIQYLPQPDIYITAIDRMLLTGLYGGLEPLFDDFFFWRKVADQELGWKQAQPAGPIFAGQRKPNTTQWVKQTEVRDGP